MSSYILPIPPKRSVRDLRHFRRLVFHGHFQDFEVEIIRILYIFLKICHPIKYFDPFFNSFF